MADDDEQRVHGPPVGRRFDAWLLQQRDEWRREPTALIRLLLFVVVLGVGVTVIALWGDDQRTLVDVVIAVLTGVGLWLFLPRGVVLTRSVYLGPDPDHPVPDTWEIRNDSALPIRVISATVTSPSSYDERIGKFVGAELPCEGDGSVSLGFDDQVAETARTDNQLPWSKVEIAPGDTLKAHVSVNHTLNIRYRRAGWAGVLERRELRIRGYA